MKLSVFYDHIREASNQTGHPIEEIAGEVRSFGITGVEVMEAQLLENREGILRVLESAGLSVNCIFCFDKDVCLCAEAWNYCGNGRL